MFKTSAFPLETMMAPAQEMFEQWISLFPAAPLFGVNYRFADMTTNPMEFWTSCGALAPRAFAPTAEEPSETAETVEVEVVAEAPAPEAETAIVLETAVETVVAEVVAEAPAEAVAAPELPLEAAAVADVAPAPIDEPAEPVAEAAAAAPVAEVAAPVIENDDLKLIKGIGPKLADELAEMGITSLAQIAAFTADELARVDAALTSIKGRCYRDDWVGQAKALIA